MSHRDSGSRRRDRDPSAKRFDSRRVIKSVDIIFTSAHTAAVLLRALLPRSSCQDAQIGLFRKLLAGSGLPKPCEQHEIRRNDRFVARVDFAYPDQRLVLETDAYMCHSARSDWQHDRWRDNTLIAMKWRVLRFTWDDVTRRPEWVLEQIHLALGSPEACRPRRGCPISTSAAGGRGATMEP